MRNKARNILDKIIVLLLAAVMLFTSVNMLSVSSSAEEDTGSYAQEEAVAEPVVEVVAEPVYEEPVYEEPVYVEPVYEEAVYAEPEYEEPVYEEPVYEEAVYAEPVYEEPAYEEPFYEEPFYEELAYEEAAPVVSVETSGDTPYEGGESSVVAEGVDTEDAQAEYMQPSSIGYVTLLADRVAGYSAKGAVYDIYYVNEDGTRGKWTGQEFFTDEDGVGWLTGKDYRQKEDPEILGYIYNEAEDHVYSTNYYYYCESDEYYYYASNTWYATLAPGAYILHQSRAAAPYYAKSSAQDYLFYVQEDETTKLDKHATDVLAHELLEEYRAEDVTEEEGADSLEAEPVAEEETPAEEAETEETAEETTQEESDPETVPETTEEFTSEEETEDMDMLLQDKEEDTEEPSEEETTEEETSEEETTEASYPEFSQSVTVDGIIITVTAEEGVFPEDAVLHASAVSSAAQTEVEGLVDSLREEDANVAVSYTYDITIVNAQGEELQPADDAKVKVSFAMAEVQDANLQANVYHVSDALDEAELLETEIEEDAVVAQSDGFSIYTVEFTYSTLTYVMQGDSRKELQEILDFVGLQGDVQDAQSSSPALFDAYQEESVWYVQAYRAFTTEQHLYVTIQNVVYEILVTDALTGDAYAVLTGSGELIFFRSLGSYANGTIQVVTDIDGNTYAGRVFTGFETSTSTPSWDNYRTNINSVRVAAGQTISPVSTHSWFDGNYMLTCDLTGLDTSNVTNMSYMFANSWCESLTGLDAGSFDTSAVTNMEGMFYGCNRLTELDLSSFVTSNVTNMYRMFSECESLTELDLSSFDTSGVTDMSSMFFDCVNLTDLDISSFNTAAVEYMSLMFYDCESLTELDLSRFTFNNPSISGMLSGLYSLETLKLGAGAMLSYDSGPEGTFLQASSGNILTDSELNALYSTGGPADTYYKAQDIAFRAGMGSFENGDKTKYYTAYNGYVPSSVQIEEPTREHYVFGGWQGSTGAVHIDGDPFVGKTQQAVWTPHTYTIILNPNGAAGTEESITVNYGQAYQLPDDLFTREGYVLSSWNTRTNGSGTGYAAGEAVSNLCQEANDSIRLYAQWAKEMPVAIELYTHTGDVYDPEDYDIYHNYETIASAGTPVIDILRDLGIVNSLTTGEDPGWEIDEKGRALTHVKIYVGDSVLYEWMYDMGRNEVPSLPVTIDPSYIDPEDGKVHIFIEKDADATAQFLDDVTGENSTRFYITSLYGTARDYRSGTNYSGATYANAQQSGDYRFPDGWCPVPSVTKIGSREFYGYQYQNKPQYSWSVNSSGLNIVIIKNRPTYVFTSIWKYRVNFHANGGVIVNGMGTDLSDEEEYTFYSLPQVVRPGYEFAGWFFEDGVTELQEGDTVNLETQGNDFYAHWVEVPEPTYVAVVFNQNEGRGLYHSTFVQNGISQQNQTSPLTLYYPVGSVLDIENIYLVRTGYDFAGWLGNDGNYYYGGEILTEDLILTAQWAEQTCTVTFDPGSGSMYGINPVRTVVPGNTLDRIPGARRNGYVFEGWYTAPDGQGSKLTNSTVINSNITYYAYYVPSIKNNTTSEYSYSIAAEWTNASNDITDNINGMLDFHPQTVSSSSSSKFTATLHVRFEMDQFINAGDYIPTGAVSIDIPYSPWKDREGGTLGTNNLSANLPVYPQIRNGMYFSYRTIQPMAGYQLLNNQNLYGGTGVDVEIAYSIQQGQIRDILGGATDENGNYVPGYAFYNEEIPVTFRIDADLDGVPEVEEVINLRLEVHTSARTTLQARVPTVSYNKSDTVKTDGSYIFVEYSYYPQNTLTERSMPAGIDVQQVSAPGGVLVEQGGYNFVVAYPLSILKNAPPTGVTLTHSVEGTLTEEDGYVRHLVAQSEVKLFSAVYPRGDFAKRNEDPYARVVTKQGWQNRFALEETPLDLTWYTTYTGADRDTPLIWDSVNNTYIARPRVIEITDGIPGDILYSSGSAPAPYVWDPATGNETIEDADYDILNVQLSVNEQDADCDEGVWSGLYTADGSRENTVELLVRYRGSNEFVLYRTLHNVKNTLSTIALPEHAAGFKVRLHTSAAGAFLNVNPTIRFYPTQHLKNLISADLITGVNSVIKNNAVCNIWNEDDVEMTPFFHVEENTGGMTPANKVIYELTPYRARQYTYKASGASNTTILDVMNGTQDNPIYIAGYNYTTADSIIPVTSGIFYDLLPPGTDVDEATIFGIPLLENRSSLSNLAGNYNSYKNSQNKLDRTLYDVEFIPNWQDSGFTMMVIRFSVPSQIKASGMQFWYLLHNTYGNVMRNGTELENDVAFVNTSYNSLPEEWHNTITYLGSNLQYYESLDDQYSPYITYDSALTSYVPVSAYSWGYEKTVKSDVDYVKSARVLPGREYSYKLSYSQSDEATSKNIVFFDLLEGGYDIDEGGVITHMDSDWYGELQRVDVSSASSKLTKNSSSLYCGPVIYYATKDRDLFTGTDFDVTNTSTWTTTRPADASTITAIAVDCSYCTDGTDFVLDGRQVLDIEIVLKAPVDDTVYGTSAYNHAVIRKKNGETPDAPETELTSNAMVTLEDITPEIHKESDPETGTELEPAVVFVNQSLDYTLHVTNTDPEFTIFGVVVEDSIPQGLHITQDDIRVAFGDDEPVAVQETPRISMDKSGQDLTFTISSLLPGETAHIMIPTMVEVESVLFENTSYITEVDGMEKEIESETTYHIGEEEPETVVLTIRKENVTGSLLAGAVLEITGRGLHDASDITPIRWKTVSGTEHIITLEPGIYTLHEVTPPVGYECAPDIVITLNEDKTVTMVDPEAVKLTVIKEFNDEGYELSRPGDLTFSVYQDNVYLQDITISENDGWSGNLWVQRYDATDGHEYTYTVEEQDAALLGYVAAYEYINDGRMAVVTNTPLKSVSGKKIWDDNNDPNRPSSITVNLFQNGLLYDSQEVTEADAWEYSFDVPVYDAYGNKYVYTVEEDYLPGYAVTVDTPQAKGMQITFRRGLAITEALNIYYKYGGNTYLYRSYISSLTESPRNITLRIPADEVYIQYNRSSNYNYNTYGLEFLEILPLQEAPAVIGSVTTEQNWDSIPVETEYSNMYTAHYVMDDTSYNWVYTFPKGYSYDITNTPLPPDATTIRIIKEDEEGDPVIGAHLQLLDAQDTVIREWNTKDTPQVLEGIEPGIYTLHEESAPDGYAAAQDMEIEILNTTSVQEFTMVDETLPEKSFLLTKTDEEGTPIEGAKFRVNVNVQTVSSTCAISWSDNNDYYHNRPESVTVYLSNGSAVVATEVLSDDNNWSVTIDNLPKYDGNSQFVYTWTQELSDLNPGYVASNTRYTRTQTTFENTFTQEFTSLNFNVYFEAQDASSIPYYLVQLYCRKNDVRTANHWLQAGDVMAGNAKGYRYTFSNLPMYENGIMNTYEPEVVNSAESYTVKSQSVTGNTLNITYAERVRYYLFINDDGSIIDYIEEPYDSPSSIRWNDPTDHLSETPVSALYPDYSTFGGFADYMWIAYNDLDYYYWTGKPEIDLSTLPGGVPAYEDIYVAPVLYDGFYPFAFLNDDGSILDIVYLYNLNPDPAYTAWYNEVSVDDPVSAVYGNAVYFSYWGTWDLIDYFGMQNYNEDFIGENWILDPEHEINMTDQLGYPIYGYTIAVYD